MQNRYKHVSKRTTIRRALALLAEEGLIVKRPGIGSIVADRQKPMIAFIASAPRDRVRSLSHHFISPVCAAKSPRNRRTPHQTGIILTAAL